MRKRWLSALQYTAPEGGSQRLTAGLVTAVERYLLGAEFEGAATVSYYGFTGQWAQEHMDELVKHCLT